jgi:hypothetical protein
MSMLRYTAAGVALATVGFAPAAHAVTDDATVTAEILTTLQIQEVAGNDVLNFGQISDTVGLAANADVTVAPDGTVTCGVGLTCAGTANAPEFEVSGLAGAQVIVTFPASITLNHAGGAPASMQNQMTVSNFTTDLAANPFALAAGWNPFSVGGTLAVRPLQAPGIYTGAVTITVEYN